MSLAIDIGIDLTGKFKVGASNLEFRSQTENLPGGKNFCTAVFALPEVHS